MLGTVDGSIEMDENPWASKECTERPDAGEDDDDEMVDVWNPDRPVTDTMSVFWARTLACHGAGCHTLLLHQCFG